jgi:cytochrome P450
MAITLSHDELVKDPYRVYSRLRREAPIAPVEGHFIGAALFVSRYDDALAILKDVRFSNEQRKVKPGRDLAKAWWIPSVLRAFLNSMVMVDDPDHTRLRKLVHKAFTPRMIQQMAERIEAISNNLLDEAAKKPTVDLMADFALLPLAVISGMMGVPAKDRLKFHQWSGMFAEAGPSSKLQALTILRNAFLMQRFFKGLISTRRKNPQNDLITALVQTEESGDRMSEDELVAMLFLRLFAGHQTTVNLIGNGMLALLENPDQFAKLKANPNLLDSAIEEMLRYTNPVQQVAPLARLEARIAFQNLFERFPNIELAVPPSEMQWRLASTLRGLQSLPVRLKV